jgi:hypothetical protein
VFTASTCLAKVVLVKFTAQPWMCAILCAATKQAVNLSVHQDGRCVSTGIPRILAQKLALMKTEYHTIVNKYSEAASVVQSIQ